MQEVVFNGFEKDLCLNESDLKQHEWTILEIVDKKMEHPRHKAMNSPLDRGEMLSIILYTGMFRYLFILFVTRKRF